MRKHTRSTPAGVPRSRAKLTRRERRCTDFSLLPCVVCPFAGKRGYEIYIWWMYSHWAEIS